MGDRLWRAMNTHLVHSSQPLGWASRCGYGEFLDLTTAMQPFIDKARKTKGAKGISSAKSGVDTAQVREWAREQGLPISDRGRVPAEILDAYREQN